MQVGQNGFVDDKEEFPGFSATIESWKFPSVLLVSEVTLIRGLFHQCSRKTG